MKYCLHYTKDSKFKNEVDELIINYDGQLEPLLTFLDEHPNQRTILLIKDELSFSQQAQWQTLNDLSHNHNIAICFGEPQKANSKHLLEVLNNLSILSNIDYFFGNLIVTWEQLNFYLSIGVSDVYLAENMCFDLPAANLACSRKGVKIRAFPNVAQSSISQEPGLKKFFIRPEDAEYYSMYIDVLEFWGPIERQDVYYLIYHKKGRWLGDLNEIIFDLNISLDSRRILPVFAQSRVNCRKKCSRDSYCAICTRLADIADTLADKNIILRKEKNY